MEREIVELNQILPGLEINFNRWWESERDVIEPALRAANYTNIGVWLTVHATSPEGKRFTICYG